MDSPSHDITVTVPPTYSPLPHKTWFCLPKDGDIAKNITVQATVDSTVSFLVAGERVWSMDAKQHEETTIPFAVNMLKLGDHPAIVEIHNKKGNEKELMGDFELKLTYTLFDDIEYRRNLATETRADVLWFEAKSHSGRQYTHVRLKSVHPQSTPKSASEIEYDHFSDR
jgi:hypothetical protein